ncbi:hypothetical protein [Pseudomonas mucidolens]|uniref:A-factor biosynthesis hotdog domain-containing protein n=1 Tax=Pseudomonas mucidolens TaxID=46679 RepID=A0A1H2MIS1_9PSED|nr:hypothetical protein [Pseudomonas mucidolens]SDU92396.1 hypothetical protein SAMN05216202_1693 [Pseudomonas mucidolens]SQH33893.1 Uncharacterised protein [Pseudomonas mucidolens]
MNQTFQIPSQSERVAVDMAKMASSIAVQRPYFAFRSLYKVLSEWDIWGDFKPEQPLGSESGPLATAEAGRHLAILGSCAAALSQTEGERVYYLAAQAKWDLQCHSTDFTPRQLMTARAKIVDRSRKMVTAKTELLIEGRLFGTLSVRYQILAEKTFEKLFSSHREPIRSPSVSSPYTRAFPLSVLALSAREITASSIGFSPVLCEGHFPEYPMWPVAVVMYGMSQVTARLLDHRMGRNVFYRVLYAVIEADELVPANKQLVFSARFAFMSADGKLCDVVCSTSYERRVIATTRIELAIE